MDTSFTPAAGLLGGGLIGLATGALLLASGKIAGISGILGRSLFPERADLAWRLAFLAGLPLGAWVASWIGGDPHGFAIRREPMLLIAAGLLVGVGTQLANGCTSGHGVCGIARGSRRSILATGVFMTTALVVVFVLRHVLGGQVS